MGLTASDLAKACGVSRSTVNRALLGEGRINKDTKEMILKKAKELGYKPNLLARSLAVGKSMTIGVIVADINNQYFAGIIDAVGKRVKDENYFLTITFHEKNKETEKELIEKLVSFQTSGLIISPINKGREFEEYLSGLPVPTVIIGNDMKRTTSVGIDEFQAAADAVRYIMKKGYKNIVFCCPPLKDDDNKYNLGHILRLRGYQSVMKENNLKAVCIYGDDYLKKVKKHTENSKERPAYLCSGDIFANEILTYLHGLGYSLRKDFGVMGFDFVKAYQNGIVNISTIDNHITQIGTEAADILLRMIKGDLDWKENYHKSIHYQIEEGNTL